MASTHFISGILPSNNIRKTLHHRPANHSLSTHLRSKRTQSHLLHRTIRPSPTATPNSQKRLTLSSPNLGQMLSNTHTSTKHWQALTCNSHGLMYLMTLWTTACSLPTKIFPPALTPLCRRIACPLLSTVHLRMLLLFPQMSKPQRRQSLLFDVKK